MSTVECGDAVQVPLPAQIANAPSLLAYSNGNSFTNTWTEYPKERPDLAKKHWIVPVTLSCTLFGHCYDIEPGGGKNANIGAFLYNAKKVWKTHLTWGLQWLYTFASNLDDMIDAAASFGYTAGKDYYILCAHPNTDHGRHLCSNQVCGYPRRYHFQVHGTQYLFAGAYDRSLLQDYMLPRPIVTVPSLHGKLRVEVELNADTGVWTTKSLPGEGVKLGGHNRRWHCDLSVGEQHGDWQSHPGRFT